MKVFLFILKCFSLAHILNFWPNLIGPPQKAKVFLRFNLFKYQTNANCQQNKMQPDDDAMNHYCKTMGISIFPMIHNPRMIELNRLTLMNKKYKGEINPIEDRSHFFVGEYYLLFQNIPNFRNRVNNAKRCQP